MAISAYHSKLVSHRLTTSLEPNLTLQTVVHGNTVIARLTVLNRHGVCLQVVLSESRFAGELLVLNQLKISSKPVRDRILITYAGAQEATFFKTAVNLTRCKNEFVGL